MILSNTNHTVADVIGIVALMLNHDSLLEFA